MQYVPYLNQYFEILPEEKMPEAITCERYTSGICIECTCTACNRTGHIVWKDPNSEDLLDLHIRRCSCDKIALSRHRIKEAGLKNLFEKCSMNTYLPDSDAAKELKRAAEIYISIGINQGNSFFISGKPGSGKTHLCVAISQAIYKKGCSFTFFQWVSDSTKLKGCITDNAAYSNLIKPLYEVDLLYIDDLFKNSPSEADKRLAMDILNKRYNSQKPCIISSEKSLDDLYKIDAAIGGRIAEMCKKYAFISPGKDRRKAI